jgi:trans-2,3-dihydro-3-hydroxyanthranilate isomerase
LPRRYAILDVFTDRPLAGNPLAVVLDAAGLDDRRMQAIAREFNLSETIFVLPAINPMHRAGVRIFTPACELPFAGHPIVGTAVILALEAAAQNASRREMVMVLEAKVGPIRCGVTITAGKAGHGVFDAPRGASEAGTPGDHEAIATALGLEPAEIGFENHHPSVFAAGNAFTFVPVRDLAVIARAKPIVGAWAAAFGEKILGAFLYCRETATSGHQFHARVFAPDAGVIEDPATGSAAAAFVGVIRRFDALPAGSHRFVIEQGFEMGRPSLMSLEIDIDAGEVSAARIGGDAVVVAEGSLNA